MLGFPEKENAVVQRFREWVERHPEHYIPDILPPVFTRNGDELFTRIFISELGIFITIVVHEEAEPLDDMFEIIREEKNSQVESDFPDPQHDNDSSKPV